MSKIYKAEYADGEMEVFSYCDNDSEAMKKIKNYLQFDVLGKLEAS